MYFQDKKLAEVDNYPSDLEELAREYDDLVGSKVWEIINWMDPSTKNLKYPRVVRKNHELINDLFPSPETQADDVVLWLKEHFPTFQDLPQVVPPKVSLSTRA